MTWQIREGSTSGTIRASGTTGSISSGSFTTVGYYTASTSTTYYLTGVTATATGKAQSALATVRSGTTPSATRTSTPSITGLSCTQSGFTYTLSATIKNNDASSVTMEVSRSSNFVPKVTTTFTAGQTKSVDVSSGSSSYVGSQTVYARATASGETLSLTAQRTQNINICISDGGGFG